MDKSVVRSESAGSRPRAQLAREVGHRQSGQSLVELALLLPVLVLISFGALDFGRVMYSYVTVSSAAQAGAEYAARSGTTNPSVVRQAALKEAGPYLSGASEVADTPGAVLVSPVFGVTGDQVVMVEVSVTYYFSPITPLFTTGTTMPVRAKATAPRAAKP